MWTRCDKLFITKILQKYDLLIISYIQVKSSYIHIVTILKLSNCCITSVWLPSSCCWGPKLQPGMIILFYKQYPNNNFILLHSQEGGRRLRRGHFHHLQRVSCCWPLQRRYWHLNQPQLDFRPDKDKIYDYYCTYIQQTVQLIFTLLTIPPPAPPPPTGPLAFANVRISSADEKTTNWLPICNRIMCYK